MDISKQKKFNERMGRQKFARGGRIHLKHFDTGGSVPGVGQNTTTNAESTSGLNALSPMISNIPVVGDIYKGLGEDKIVAPVLSGVNGLLTGNATQNQYQANLAPTQMSDYSNAINQSYGNVQNIQGQQQQLANQLGQRAAGGGPNPAAAALAQETGQNVNQQAALMAGQRGAAGNVGLMARQNAQQGAATQQNAVGQAANMQAQQQIAAQQALAQQQSAMAQQNIGLYGTSAGAQNTQNANNISNYSQAQGINATTAAANTAALNKSNSGLLGGIGSALGGLYKGGEVKNYDEGGMASDGGNDVGQVAPMSSSSQQSGGSSGSSKSGAGGIMKIAAMFDDGGEIPEGAVDISGGTSSGGYPLQPQSAPTKSGPSAVGKFFSGYANAINSPDAAQPGSKASGAGGGGQQSAPSPVGRFFNAYSMQQQPMIPGPHKSSVANYLESSSGVQNKAEGGKVNSKVPAMVSPGEIYLNKEKVQRVLNGEDPLKIGERIQGKAKVKGNSLKNDIVPKTLEEGGVVINRTHTNKPERAELFVRRAVHLKKNGK